MHYIRESDQYMHSLFMCMDNAWSAEKMYDWSNLGEKNKAWVEGPYISAGANRPQIDRTQPYCLRLSSASSRLAGYQIGPQPKVGKDGGVALSSQQERINANVIIPTVAVCMQFALLEALDITLFTDWATRNAIDLNSKPAKRYDRRPARSRMETLNELCQLKISNECINAYESVANFRNKLTHEPQFFCGIPECAIDVYIVCQAVSYSIYQSLHGDCNEEKISHRKSIWSARISRFDTVMDFE